MVGSLMREQITVHTQAHNVTNHELIGLQSGTKHAVCATTAPWCVHARSLLTHATHWQLVLQHGDNASDALRSAMIVMNLGTLARTHMPATSQLTAIARTKAHTTSLRRLATMQCQGRHVQIEPCNTVSAPGSSCGPPPRLMLDRCGDACSDMPAGHDSVEPPTAAAHPAAIHACDCTTYTYTAAFTRLPSF